MLRVEYQQYINVIYNLKNSKLCPLTKSVGLGSMYNTYFVHIEPKKINIKNKNIYLIGKSVTFDSGGLNLKSKYMEEMKTDMTGSAILLSILNLLNKNKEDIHYNIHILIPIVENMISNTSIRPGMVVTTMSGKTIEIINTDVEGRLCIVDCIEYINLKLCNNFTKNIKLENCIIIDIATLTGNTSHITSGISGLVMCNNNGIKYVEELIKIGENIGEYVDYLKIRNEYLDSLTSNVADIANISNSIKADCVLAGTFLSYFCDSNIPWIHIDVDTMATSYGINLMYQFIKKII